jgi:acetyl esterase/lipase
MFRISQWMVRPSMAGRCCLPATARGPVIKRSCGFTVDSSTRPRRHRTMWDSATLDRTVCNCSRPAATWCCSRVSRSSPNRKASDPYLDHPKGVLPAIDKAIAMGFVDPGRLAVAGHSYGGYSSYSLITQTNRFKAAIAMAGFCNLVSLYGSLDARFRHEDATARDRLLHMVFSEAGQFRLGGPPYQDLDRYIRNSPITYTSRVTTPVMIVQGDMDYVPIQQGEEFYTAMFRQNKPASFVRYWGEGHILQSPPNILDLWERIFQWLDRFLNS